MGETWFPPRERAAGEGGSVSSVTAESRFDELDELVLHLKGLVLVRRLREQRGADSEELLMYRTEIERVREQLANLVKGRRGD